jgi:hypothetical protein
MSALVLGLLLTCGGVALWPRRLSPVGGGTRRDGAQSGRSDDAPATDVALAARLLVIALRTGLPVPSALERVAQHSRPHVAADLHRVVREYARSADDPAVAWSAAPVIWSPLSAALIVAGRAGVAPGPLLATSAGAVLRRESEVREVAIGTAGVRLVLPLGLVLLPAFMCTTVIPLVLVMTRGHLTG